MSISLVYTVKALAENILRVRHDKEGTLVDIPDEAADLRYLRALYDAHDDLLFLMGIRPLGMEQRDAAVKYAGGDLLDDGVCMLADDVDDAGVIKAVEHKVNGTADDEHADERIHRAFDDAENEGIGCDDDRVHQQDERAEIDIREAAAEKTCDYIHTARRRADVIDGAEAEALYNAADDAGEHGVRRGDDIGHCRRVDEHGVEHRADKGADDEVSAELLPRDDEKRNVENYAEHADGKPRQAVYDLRNTRKPAGNDGVREHEKLKSRRAYRRANNDERVLHDLRHYGAAVQLVFDRVHQMPPSARESSPGHYSSSSESCCSSLSSGFRSAPAAGRLRTR